MENSVLTSRGLAMLNKMHEHVHQRLNKELDKWDGRSDSQAKQSISKAKDKYVLASILEKGSKCASRISVATHVAKATHPDLKVRFVSNPNVRFGELPYRSEVGSHLLPDTESLADTTGDGAVNSAAYELYLLLDSKFEDKTFGEWLKQENDDALTAFAKGLGTKDNSDIYTALLEKKTPTPATDPRLKQIYWLVGDDPRKNADYHLLTPLYATSLTHRVYLKVSPNTWFYGDNNKAARKARRGGMIFEGGYISYPDLAVQKLGGTKPQNISQLNSARVGQSYLLASLPPNWQSRDIYPPMRDAFRAFKRRPAVRNTVYELKHFLETDPAKNMHTRNLRDDLITMLVDELMLFTFDMHSLAPGWTADDKCELVAEEQYWLDPGRAYQDVEFDHARLRSPWHKVISDRAAGWLNRELNYKSALNVGDPEHDYWQKRIEAVLKNFCLQLNDLQDALRDDDESLQGEPA